MSNAGKGRVLLTGAILALVIGFGANRQSRAGAIATASATSWEAVIQDPRGERVGRSRVNQFRARSDGERKFTIGGRFGRDAVIVQIAPNPISPAAP